MHWLETQPEYDATRVTRRFYIHASSDINVRMDPVSDNPTPYVSSQQV